MKLLCTLLLAAMILPAVGPSQQSFVAAQKLIEAGDYDGALKTLAVIRCQPEDGAACAPRVKAMRGASHLFSGRYEQALPEFSAALAIYRKQGVTEQVIDLLNNIGTVHFYQGEYAEAHACYVEAQRELGGRQGEKWFASGAHLTAANMATLYQRLGRYREAMEAYRALGPSPAGLSGAERAQLLSNMAALNRRLGDPWKTRALLEQALALLSPKVHNDAWLGVVKNLGIVLALDFDDLRGAGRRFAQAIGEADRSGNAREALQARLYQAEARFRAGEARSAEALWSAVLVESRRLRTAEEEWRSLFGLARVLIKAQRQAEGAQLLRQAIEKVEALRGGIGATTMKTDFLSDKNEIYEEALAVQADTGNVAGAFDTMERARALALREAVETRPATLSLVAFQQRLRASEAAVFYKAGRSRSFLLWATRNGAGLRRIDLTEAEAARLAGRLRADVNGAGEAKQALAGALLSGIPALREPGIDRLWIAPDGLFSLLPFELLAQDGRMLVERFEVAYLPAASLFRRAGRAGPVLRWPWQRELLAYADPDVSSVNLLPGDERWAQLPESFREAESVRGLLPGSGLVYRGGQVTPAGFLQSARGVPVLHLATHGAGDPESAQRNRLLVGNGYLYGPQLSAGKLAGVQLAVLSACDTDVGTLSRGEGVQSLARRFLLAGARATVASLWKVDDGAARAFMEEFYRELAQGAEAAGALRQAKLRFLHSNGRLREPRHWAAFVIQGAADEPLPRWVSWRELAWAAAGVLGIAALAVYLINRRRAAG